MAFLSLTILLKIVRLLKNQIMRIAISLIICLSLYQSFYAQGPALMLPIGHNSELNSIAFNKLGNRLLSSSDDKTAKLWDVQTGQILINFKGHIKPVVEASFNADETKVLSKSLDGTAKLWDATSGKMLFSIQRPAKTLMNAAFSNDGNFVVSSFLDSIYTVTDAKTGAFIKTMQMNIDAADTAFFNPNGKQICVLGRKPAVYLFDASSFAFSSIELPAAPVRAQFNSSGNVLAVLCVDGIVRLFVDGKTIPIVLKNPGSNIHSFVLTPDGKKLISVAYNHSILIWDLFTGLQTGKLPVKIDKTDFTSIAISQDGKKLLTIFEVDYNIWDLDNLLSVYHEEVGEDVSNAVFHPNGQAIAFSALDLYFPFIREAQSGKYGMEFRGHFAQVSIESFSPDGSKIITGSNDGRIRIWNAGTGVLEKVINAHQSIVIGLRYNAAGTKIISTSADSLVKIWDAVTGKLVTRLTGHNAAIISAEDTRDGNRMLTVCENQYAYLWYMDENTKRWKVKATLKHPKGNIINARFSPDFQNIITVTSSPSSANLWDAYTGQLVGSFNVPDDVEITKINFSPDSRKVVFTYIANSKANNGPIVFDAKTAQLLAAPNIHKLSSKFALFNPDGSKLVSVDNENNIYLVNAINYQLIKSFKGLVKYENVFSVKFSYDGAKLLFCASDNNATIYDVETGSFFKTLKGHTDDVVEAYYSVDDKYILTSSIDNSLKRWNAQTGELLYTFMAIDSADYLLVDQYDRYDGTPAARKLLYFTCGTEIIQLDQFKDLSWEPGLIGKIMGVNKDPITAKKLSEINICNVTPLVIYEGIVDDYYQYKITQRSGGLGDVQLYVNGKMIRTIPKSQLIAIGSSYGLKISSQEVQPYFVSGINNTITVKATTNAGSMTSRGGDVETAPFERSTVNPNVYLVSVGINLYKGEKLKLNYASTDAESFASAVTASAKKLFNIDSKDHIKSSLFSTEATNPNKPTKLAIRKQMELIAQQAGPDDILVFFFAGHGVLQAGQKNFYLLTQEASALEINGVENDVAISADELNGWLRNIKANKQLLILDACNSGQMVNDLQNLVVKRDLPADQVRALENLKDKTGTFILSASASGQSAYETSQFGQGLLTYSLLSSIKYQSALRESKYLDVTKWFNTASAQARDLAKEIGGRQDPQIIGAASFDIGLVDKDVMDGINISGTKKKLFGRSNFYTGDPSLLLDEVQISIEFDKLLNQESAKGKASVLNFNEAYNMPEAYSIRGNYSITNGVITIKASLVNKNKRIGTEVIKSGSIDYKQNMIQTIIDELLISIN
jgi:WD40 repeat protein